MQGVAEDQAVLPAVQVLVRAADFLADALVALAEQVEGLPAFGVAALQGFQHGLRGQPLVDEQRQRGHRDAAALGLAAPVQEGGGQALQLFRGLPRLGQRVAVENFPDEPLAFAARCGLVPGQLRRERRIVAPRAGWLAFGGREDVLGAAFRAQQGFVGVAVVARDVPRTLGHAGRVRSGQAAGNAPGAPPISGGCCDAGKPGNSLMRVGFGSRGRPSSDKDGPDT